MPRATRLRKIETLENDLLAFCEERGAADFCRARLRGGLKQLNSRSKKIASRNPLGALLVSPAGLADIGAALNASDEATRAGALSPPV